MSAVQLFKFAHSQAMLAASCLRLTSPTMALRSSISACEFSKLVCRALLSSSRRVDLC